MDFLWHFMIKGPDKVQDLPLVFHLLTDMMIGTPFGQPKIDNRSSQRSVLDDFWTQIMAVKI